MTEGSPSGKKDIKDDGSDDATEPETKESEEFVYEPGKVSIKFIFANRDGLHVQIQCEESATVGTVKGSLLSMWPKELETCDEGERIRLICMGRGILSPDSSTLEELNIPVFKTHPTPVNVSVKPAITVDTGISNNKKGHSSRNVSGGSNGVEDNSSCCVIC